MANLESIQLQDTEHTALLVDLETFDCKEVLASDFSRKGCRLHAQSSATIDKPIGLRIPGLDKMIRGRVHGFCGEDALVRFEFKNDDQIEKRTERRRRVAIETRVSGLDDRQGVKGKIVDASPSGCRLSCYAVSVLPDEVHLRIPRFDQPIRGRIMWRGAGVAGVKMLWDFSSKSDDVFPV